MKRGVATLTVADSGLIESFEAAERAGYDIVDIWVDQLREYLVGERPIEELAERFANMSIQPGVINPILDIEIPNGAKRDELLAGTRRICEVASASGIGGLQLVSGVTYAGEPWSTICKGTARGLREMADLAAEYSLKVGFEPIAWWPVRKAKQALEIIAKADRPNVGVVLDSFHIFAAQDDLEFIRTIDPTVISSVHLGDCVQKTGSEWSDEQRAMPGEGVAPIREIIEAILSTGYDGVIADEIWPVPYAGQKCDVLYRELKDKSDKILASVRMNNSG